MKFNQSQKIETIKTPELKVKEGVNFVFEKTPELSKIGTKEQYTKYLDTIFPDSKVKDIVYHGSDAGEKFLPPFWIKYGNKIEKFSEKERGSQKRANDIGFYFSPSPEEKFKAEHEVFSDFYWNGAKNYGKHIYPVMLNLKNPANSDFALCLTKEVEDELKNKGYDSMIATSDISKAGYMHLVKEHINLKSFGLVEYIAFEPEQAHILGSRKDLEEFKNFVSKK